MRKSNLLLTKSFFYSLLILVSSASCNQIAELEDIERSDYEAEYALPLVNTSFSMNNLLENFEENSVLSVDPSGLLRLRYTGDVLTQTADDVFAAINQQLTQTGFFPLTGAQQALPFTFPDGISFDRMDLKGGNFIFALPNCNETAITVTVAMPTVTLNGEPLTVTRTIPAYSGTGDCPIVNNILFPISMTGYTVVPENDSIYITYHAVDGNGMEVGPSDNTLVSFGQLSFNYIEGYLGTQDHSSSRDTIDIDFFDNWIRGDVCFEEPTITLHFENSFGIPTRSVIEAFEIFTVNGNVLPLESEFVEDGIDFPFPTLDQIGETVATSFTFNKGNSNIKDILCEGPVALDYDVDAQTNPEGDPSIRGFATDSSFYKVQVEVDLPFYGYAVDFSVRDTFALGFDNYTEIDFAEFKLITDNGMPVSIEVQGYFLDNTGVVIDSLLGSSQRVIGGAPVDLEGLPTGPNTVTTFSNFDSDRFTKIKQANQLEIVATFYTTTDGDQPVKVLADQEVAVKIGAILGRSN